MHIYIYFDSGSPVKAENVSSERKHLESILEDPRPPKYRNMAGYNDKVRNSVINFCAHTFMDMAPRYIYPKANIQQASIDHNYLRKPFTEYWIDTAQAASSFQDYTITFVCKYQFL